MIQWLELGALTAKGPGFDPGRGITIPPAAQEKKKRRKKGKKSLWGQINRI